MSAIWQEPQTTPYAPRQAPTDGRGPPGVIDSTATQTPLLPGDTVNDNQHSHHRAAAAGMRAALDRSLDTLNAAGPPQAMRAARRTYRVIADVLSELAIWTEEGGAGAQAILQTQAGGPVADDLRKNAIQNVAIAFAIVDAIDTISQDTGDPVTTPTPPTPHVSISIDPPEDATCSLHRAIRIPIPDGYARSLIQRSRAEFDLHGRFEIVPIPPIESDPGPVREKDVADALAHLLMTIEASSRPCRLLYISYVEGYLRHYDAGIIEELRHACPSTDAPGEMDAGAAPRHHHDTRHARPAFVSTIYLTRRKHVATMCSCRSDGIRPRADATWRCARSPSPSSIASTGQRRWSSRVSAGRHTLRTATWPSASWTVCCMPSC